MLAVEEGELEFKELISLFALSFLSDCHGENLEVIDETGLPSYLFTMYSMTFLCYTIKLHFGYRYIE